MQTCLTRPLCRLYASIIDVVLLTAAAVLVLVTRAFRPAVVVRFGSVFASRIGPLAAGPDIYLGERELGLRDARVLDVFYPEGHATGDAPLWSWRHIAVANRQLLAMWRRALLIHPFVRQLARVNRRLPGGADHIMNIPAERDMNGVLSRTGPHVSFTPDEERRGDTELAALGLPAGAPFVAFHARDRAYLSTVLGAVGSWAYHDYRDSDVETYVPAALEMVRRGWYVARMGAVVERALRTPEPMVIDYAASPRRSELLDLVLCARCRFYLGNDSGLFFVPVAFRRPVALANYLPIRWPPLHSPSDLFIPKKVWSRAERRFLGFREMISLPSRTAEYAALGLDVIANSPEEILDLAVEMDERLSGSWVSTDEDEHLQARFRTLIMRALSLGPTLSRMGARFLVQNRALLD